MGTHTTANILLIGLRGSGKSTVAKILGTRLGRPWVDLDHLTPGEIGEATIAAAFEKHGETKFRAAELRALTAVLGAPGQIIALGGGTPTAPGAEELMLRERGTGRAVVVYLRADAAALRGRLSQADNAHRPSLTGGHVLDEIDALLAARDPLYTSLADMTLQVERLDAETTADEVVKFLAGCRG